MRENLKRKAISQKLQEEKKSITNFEITEQNHRPYRYSFEITIVIATTYSE